MFKHLGEKSEDTVSVQQSEQGYSLPHHNTIHVHTVFDLYTKRNAFTMCYSMALWMFMEKCFVFVFC